MESGVIALVDGPDTLSEFHESVPAGNNSPVSELEISLEIRNETKLENGNRLYQGRAAFEEVADIEQVSIQSNGRITTRSEMQTQVQVTDFLFIPDSLILVENRGGTFLFQKLNQMSDHTVRTSTIDLDGFLSANPRSLVWKLGFKNRGDNAENGVMHGNDLLEDQEVGDILGPTEKNQLGIQTAYESNDVKMFITESGYIEIYQPSNFDSQDFAKFVLDEILEFVRPV